MYNEFERFNNCMITAICVICIICIILVWTLPDKYFECSNGTDYVYIIVDDSDSNCEYNYKDNDDSASNSGYEDNGSSNPSYEFVVTGGNGRVSPTNPFSSSSYPSVWK